MQIVHTPPGGPEQSWDVDFDDLDLEEWELIERHSGKTYEDIMSIVSRGRGTFSLLRPLLFVYLRRSDLAVSYRDVKPKMREVQFRPSLDELLALQERVEADPAYAGRAELLAELADDIAAARARGESGKGEASPTPPPSENRASRRAGRRTASSST